MTYLEWLKGVSLLWFMNIYYDLSRPFFANYPFKLNKQIDIYPSLIVLVESIIYIKRLITFRNEVNNMLVVIFE